MLKSIDMGRLSRSIAHYRRMYDEDADGAELESFSFQRGGLSFKVAWWDGKLERGLMIQVSMISCG